MYSRFEGQSAGVYLSEEPYVPTKPTPSRCVSPPERIAEWKDINKGEPVAIIGNGPSVKSEKLARINCKTIGLNQAWRLGKWTYYCIGDQAQFATYERERGSVTQLDPLFCTHASARDHGVKIWGRTSDIKYFSFDLVKDGVFLNNTICAFGIQLAVYMGHNPIYLVGVDAKGPHFYGGAHIPEQKFGNQRETYGLFAGILRCTRPDIEVFNLNLTSAVRVFPKRAFRSVFK